jgi:hypothetical protein
LLANSDALVRALGDPPTAAEAERAIHAGRRLHGEIIGSAPAESAERLRPILHRVVLDEKMVHIHLACTHLRSALGLPADGYEAEVHEIAIPARVTKRGNRLKLVIANGEPTQRKRDLSLIRVVARAHDWWQRLCSGEAGSIRDLAASKGVSGSHVRRVLRLAFLAPDIVEAILDGRQPVELTAKRLLLREDLPLDWLAQRHQLGFVPTPV